jgi:predicted amidohydrolase
MTKQVIKAGIIQFDIRVGDVEMNVARAKRRMSNLARKGVDLVLLPEMWSTGFANDRLDELAETTPRVLDELIRLSKDMHLTIIGSLPEKGADGVYNTAYVVDRDGSVLESYRKVHLFSPTREDEFFKPGRKAVVVETSLGTIGLMICYDLRFPELCRTLALQGAKIVAVMAQWPAFRVAHWKALLKARAIENQLFIIGVNRCGEDDDLSYGGHSRIISPWGEVLTRTGKGPASVSAPIDVGFVDSTREQIPCLQDRKPQAYV